MYIIDGIAYTGEQKPPLKVCGIRPQEGHKLWVRFTTGEAKVFDFSPLLDKPAFRDLRDEQLFYQVYIDFGVPVWKDGDIDISPEYLYENGTSIQ